MDVVALSRLQFALTAMFHFIFVPLTLGLSVIIAIMETIYVRSGNKLYLQMAKFWGKIFVINFVLGVVTGITLEFQFGMNWANYSKYVGDIFGAPLAIEATVAFFLESTFLGIWIFGWNKVSPKLHAFAIWMVSIGSSLSALWILIANAWMQYPVGYEIIEGKAQLVDFWAVIFSRYAWLKFFHAVTSGYIVGSFFVMGVSAYHILKGQHVEFFRRSFNIAAVFGLASSLAIAIVGDLHAKEVARTQPSKFAAMESVWETRSRAPLYLIAWPDEKNETNIIELLPLPGFLSYLAYGDFDAQVQGMLQIPREERPPVWLTFLSFRSMVGLGIWFIILSLCATFYAIKGKWENKKFFLKLLIWSIPLPFIAAELGWIVAEVGRQPWIVYGIMKTAEGVSPGLSPAKVWFSLVGFSLIYTILALIGIFLTAKFAKQGPQPIH